MDRRTLLKLLLASAVAEAVDVEQLLWTPKPIITVPAMPVIGSIDKATYTFWRNQQTWPGGWVEGVIDYSKLKEEMRRIYNEVTQGVAPHHYICRLDK